MFQAWFVCALFFISPFITTNVSGLSEMFEDDSGEDEPEAFLESTTEGRLITGDGDGTRSAEYNIQEDRTREELNFLRTAINGIRHQDLGIKSDSSAAYDTITSSCGDLYDRGYRTSGVYLIGRKHDETENGKRELVYCDLSESPRKVVAGVIPTDTEFTFYDGSEGEVKWGRGCFIDGNDIDVVDIRSEDCGAVCVANPNCTHFSWYRYKCYIKNFSERPKATYRFFSVCGWIPDTTTETRLGQVEVKWSPIFHVQRNLPYEALNLTIAFDQERMDSDSLNKTSGIFTAPKSGVYFFSFSLVLNDVSSCEDPVSSVHLQLNNDRVAAATKHSTADNLTVLKLQSLLKLQANDRISIMYFSADCISDELKHLTTFKGFLFRG